MSEFSTGWRLLRRALAMSPREMLSFGYVLFLFALAELGLRVLPLPRLARLAGAPLAFDDRPSRYRHETGTLLFDAREKRLLRAVRRIAPRLYGTERGCLRRSLVLGRVLRRRRPVLRLGMKQEAGSFAAHAWVEVDCVRVEGDMGFLPFTTAPLPTCDA